MKSKKRKLSLEELKSVNGGGLVGMAIFCD